MPRKRPTRNGLLLCIECQRTGDPYPWKPPESFYPHTKRPDGTYRLDSYCIPCRLAFNNTCRNARQRHDPAYRAERAVHSKRRWQAQSRETQGERRARRDHTSALIARLLDRGWSRTTIAAAMGSSRVQVRKWERQEWTIRHENYVTLRQLANAAEAKRAFSRAVPDWSERVTEEGR